MRTMHGIFDVNNDGVISFEDFKILADNFGRNVKVSGNKTSIQYFCSSQVTWDISVKKKWKTSVKS